MWWLHACSQELNYIGMLQFCKRQNFCPELCHHFIRLIRIEPFLDGYWTPVPHAFVHQREASSTNLILNLQFLIRDDYACTVNTHYLDCKESRNEYIYTCALANQIEFGIPLFLINLVLPVVWKAVAELGINSCFFWRVWISCWRNAIMKMRKESWADLQDFPN